MGVYHTNRYAACNACHHCDGIVRHQSWCTMENAEVRYAFSVLKHPEKLSESDVMSLHALGVKWDAQ